MYWPQVNDNIVENWLRSLGLAHYTEDFLDNGYDDLEMCKQIWQEDLDAIGVTNEGHREDILDAVSLLLKYGGTRVYFILDPDYQKFKNSKPTNYASYEVIDTTRENKVGRYVAASQFNVTQLLANLHVPLCCSMQQQHTSGSRIWSRGGPRKFSKILPT